MADKLHCRMVVIVQTSIWMTQLMQWEESIINTEKMVHITVRQTIITQQLE